MIEVVQNLRNGVFVAPLIKNEDTGEWDEQTGQIYSGMKSEYLQIASGTAADIVAAVTGKVIYVTWLYVKMSGTTDDVTILDAAAELLVWKAKAGNDYLELGNGRTPILRTTAGQALKAKTGATDTGDITVAYFTKDITP